MRCISILFLLFFAASSLPLVANTPVTTSDNNAYSKLRILSGRSLNTTTSQVEDSIIRLCREVEAHARLSKNTDQEFKAGQIAVNTYGLTGNFGLAVNKAQQLLEKARNQNNPLAIGLAIQAVGNSYLHTDRFDQADSVLSEAAPYIVQHGDKLMQIQILLQQIHVNLNRKAPEPMNLAIERAYTLLNNSEEIPDKQTYHFLLKSYQVSCALLEQDTELAGRLLTELQKMRPKEGFYDLWLFYIAMQYNAAIKEYTTALSFSDSTLQAALANKNGTLLRNVIQARAALFEQIGETAKACSLYREVLQQSDSLYKKRYTSQIDSLHVIYWTDQLQVSYVTRRNALYTRLIIGLFGLVVVVVVTGLLIRRKNRQLKKSREELEQMRETSADAIRTKSLFLSNMSHELRTPLNAIAGFSTVLTEDDQMDDQTKQQCGNYIRQNADLLMKLIADVTDFSALQGANIPFTFATCNVVELCNNTLKTVENVKRTAAQLCFETSLEKLNVSTDKNRLQQVLINLLINATKFTKQGTITLRLSYDEQQDEAVFTIEDTGCGIPLEKQPSIFERFEKLHEGVQGAGLGLSICKLIIEQTGGRIWIDSGYTQGARFVFTHPLQPKPQQTQE